MMRTDFLESLHSGARPLFLHQLKIPKKIRVLSLAPHPDDFDAVGITMRAFRDNGNRIELGVVTSGASGVEEGFSEDSSPLGKGKVREREQQASCRFFGLAPDQLSFLRLEEDESGHPTESRTNVARIQMFLTSRKPDVIFLPHGNDSNPGHQRTYHMLSDLVDELRMSIVAILNMDPKTINMRADLFTLFGPEDAQWKARLLRFHQSQHQRNLRIRQIGFDQRILQTNRQAASQLGATAEYAEVFQVELFENGV